jgi:hypothetical protein
MSGIEKARSLEALAGLGRPEPFVHARPLSRPTSRFWARNAGRGSKCIAVRGANYRAELSRVVRPVN